MVSGGVESLAHFVAAGEAFGRPPIHLKSGAPDAGFGVHGLVFDATALSTPEGLASLHDFFHPWLGNLNTCGRIVVLGRMIEKSMSPAAQATQLALEGFVRSVAKEVGRRGATAQLIQGAKGAEERLGPALRFFLSARAAYVTGQVVEIRRSVKAPGRVPSTRPLEGRIALVTGAARGIGRATARALADERATVVVLDRPGDEGPARRVAEEVGGHLLLQDITENDAPTTIASFLTESFGGVDIVVNNAGITRDKTLARMKRADWELCVDVNLQSVILITDHLLAEGVIRSGGRIVCLSSVAGLAGNFGQTNYASAKSGIAGYVNALGARLGRRGIAANAIAPGFIETRLTDAMPPVTREVARRVAALSQGGLPQDVSEVVTFLASPGAYGITGQTLRVCGGNIVGA